MEFVWPMFLVAAFTFLGAQRLRGYIGEVRERADWTTTLVMPSS